MAVDFENFIVADGTFKQTANIETVTAPAGTMLRGTLLGKSALGKYVESVLPTFTTTGATQTVAVAIDDIIYVAVASGSTGTGVVGHFYRSLKVIASIDLDVDDFTVGADYEDLGEIAGSQVPSAILQEEIVSAGADHKVVVYKSGSFNSTGVTFGLGQTVANTKDSLHDVSIEITNGVL